MTRKFGGPQYLNEFGLPMRDKPEKRYFSKDFAKEPLPEMRQKGRISPEAAKKIAEALKIMLKSPDQ